MNCHLVAFVVFFLGTLFQDSLAQDRGPLFSEITDIVQLSFVHDPGADGSFFMPEIMGSGGAFFDYDNDTDLDIYLIQAGSHSNPGSGEALPNRLYRQEADGTFADVTAVVGLDDTGYGMGVAVGDIDNDGWRDVYLTNYGLDALYRNEGGERFTNITSRAGISGDEWSASACFCDYDQDGYLDLYVTHYLNYDPKKECIKLDGNRGYCAPTVFPGASDTLYHNKGDGTFTDVSLQAGIRAAAEPGLGVICADFNEDGLPDFYVANDGGANLLWINQGRGTFKDEAFLSGVGLNALGRTEAGMGLAVGDAEGDGDLDLFVSHITNETNTLYRNDGHMNFEDATAASGLAALSLPTTGFGTAFLDFDHDGDLDLAVANGRVERHTPVRGARLSPYWNPYAEPNHLLDNDGG